MKLAALTVIEMPMSRAEAMTRLAACEPDLRARGVASLHLFGSVARDAARTESDLDLFVEHERGRKFSLFDLVGVKLLIEERLGVEADVTTRESLHPMLRSGIESSSVRVF